MCVAQYILLADWFLGREMALSMAVLLAAGKGYCVLENVTSAEVNGDGHVMAPFIIGCGLIGVSLLCSLISAWIDLSYERKVLERAFQESLQQGAVADARREARRRHKEARLQRQYAALQSINAEQNQQDGGSSVAGTSSDPEGWIASGPTPNPTLSPTLSTSTDGSPISADDEYDDACAFEDDATVEAIVRRLRKTFFRLHSRAMQKRRETGASGASMSMSSFAADLRSFRFDFWLLVAVAFVGFPPVSTFNGVSSTFLSARWRRMHINFTNERIDSVISLLNGVCGGTAAFVGFVVDKTNRRAIYMCLAAALMATCHFLFAFTDIGAPGIIAALGFAFAMFASAFWPSVTFVSTPGALGTAYGIMGCLQNVGLALSPIIVARLEPPNCGGSFICVELGFGVLALLASAFALWFHFLERRQAQSLKRMAQREHRARSNSLLRSVSDREEFDALFDKKM
jgi:hypothetical protein